MSMTAITALEGEVAITGQVIATDIDNGDVLTYSTAATVDGFSIDPDGTYHFDPSHPAYQSLIAGETQTLNIALTVTDNHGGTATQILTITLTGSNQGAVIAGVDNGAVTEDQVTSDGHWLETGGQLSITDPDQNQSVFVEHSGAGVISGSYGLLTIDASGAWHYAADNDQAAVQQLGQGDTLTDHKCRRHKAQHRHHPEWHQRCAGDQPEFDHHRGDRRGRHIEHGGWCTDRQ
jgi:VCBS repeat-containing protein